MSVGPHDHVKPALDALGVEERFWRVALRPGKPTWFGTRGDTLVFGLPGNPVSAMVTFLLFARPGARARCRAPTGAPGAGAARGWPSPSAQPAARRGASASRLDAPDAARATPTGPQGSHQLTSMLGADGLAIVTAGEGEVAAGASVAVELLELARRRALEVGDRAVRQRGQRRAPAYSSGQRPVGEQLLELAPRTPGRCARPAARRPRAARRTARGSTVQIASKRRSVVGPPGRRAAACSQASRHAA